ncbi:MAG TPA: alginate lyase family protein [Alphaproteobacteria bacterium]|nr:alginate lyase family protein [Alphaproteobacteria bacterium]
MTSTALRRALMTTAALAVGFAIPAGAAPKPKDAEVERPGLVMFDHGARTAQLRAAPEAAAALCGTGDALPKLVEPVSKLKETKGYGGDDAAEDFSLAVMQTAARVLAGDGEAAKHLAAQLHEWADEKALRKTDDDDPATVLALKRVLLPTIQAVAVVRDDAAFDDKAEREVEKWLDRLVKKQDTKFGDGSITDENNHRYMRDAVNMAWGAYKGSDDYYRKGVERYVEAMEQLREDGSWPHETSRGARALWYMRQSIANLVAMAEMAAVQGHDLYAAGPEGRDLHAAVKFLLDGIDDPTIVHPYAKENHVPGPSEDWRTQDLSFLDSRGHGRHYMAWAEPYMARFPDHPNTKRLAALLAKHDFPAVRPMVDDFTGGNTSCFWAPTDRTVAGR